jgi:hypothetical protein
MPSYRAAATGNWSALATWSVWNGAAWVAATSVPGSADDVWANNRTVTIDQNVTVLTLRNLLTGAPGTGTASGGFFAIAAGGISLTITNNIVNTNIWNNASAVYLLQVTATSGTVTLNFNMTAPTSSSTNLRFLLVSGAGCTVNYSGTVRGSVDGLPMILQNNNNTINMVGNIQAYNNSGGLSPIVSVTGTNAVFNLTGDIESQSSASSSSIGLDVGSTNAVVTVTGNVTNSTTAASIPLRSTSTASITVIGNITGGIATVACSLTGNGYFNHTGICSASQFVGATGFPGISSTGTSAIVISSGPFIFGPYGTMPFTAIRFFLSNNLSNYIEFASNSTNGALFPSGAPTRMTMYSPNTLSDAPAPANVRFGVVYASGSQTGTLIVPSPSNVALGIPTDNTVGTAVLTQANVKQAVWDALLTDLTTPDSIGVRLKNAATVDSTGDQIANLVNT